MMMNSILPEEMIGVPDYTLTVTRKPTRPNEPEEWEVEWDDVVVFTSIGRQAEHAVGCFVDGLERGITGSKQSLGSNSRRKIKGWMDYLEAFDSYEDFKGL